MTYPPIPFGRPMIGDEEREAVMRVLSGPTLVHGPVTREFEAAFARRIGVSHALSVANCTAALHLALFVHRIAKGDDVLVPAMTHVATAHVVELLGARPVFVDVEAETGNVGGSALVGAVTPDTKVALLVHYLGLPCEMDEIMAVARQRSIMVVEDCALAIDARHGDHTVGTFGVAGCFSFYPVKHMTTVEGGMLTTNDDDVASRIAQAKAFGYDRTIEKRKLPGLYDVTALGFNYRMNEVDAAIGLAQIDKLDRFQAARERNFGELTAALADTDEITMLPARRGKARSSHYCLNIVLPRTDEVDRNAMILHLNAAGIGTSVHYPSAVPLFSYYREKYGYRSGQFPNAEWIASQAISLPVGPHLQPGDPLRIANAVKSALVASRRRKAVAASTSRQ